MQKYPKRFSLGQRGREKKKGLGSLGKICKPKTHGGLGLDDPGVLNNVLGEKLWWRWLKDPASPWAQIWKQKYANNWQDRDQIRMSRIIKSSHIWSKYWENRAIIHKQSFWEIRDGNLAWFSEDKWQHETKLLKEEFANLKITQSK